jgi:malto-oligosyltrehalose trehalohydrolase
MGGFNGIAKMLPKWAELGITAIELMPIGDFPGNRNWGYDGVLPFAPDRAYGTPDDLKALIDAAHALGLMVFLDVVYNHFGPDGNYLPLYASRFFRNDVTTSWGDAIDFREPNVRRFFVENALYWVHEFHVDGLRFDAAHAIEGDDFLIELASALRESVAGQSRYLHLVLESDKNDSALLQRGFDAQWNDDLHHVLHVMLTGESEGYYIDYAARPAENLARALTEGFIYQGEPSPFRGGEKRGTLSAHLPPTSFVAFLQNHDQIGNRAFGERLTELTHPEALKAAIALILLCPQIPLLFMGEESGATEPFLYFTDHHPNLAEIVRQARRTEFAKFPAFADEQRRALFPDPNAPETFERSQPMGAASDAEEWRSFYRLLLHLRHDRIVPRLKGAKAEDAVAAGEGAVVAHWRLGDGARLTLAANLGAETVPASLPQTTPLWGAAARGAIPPMTTLCWIDPP